MTTLLRNNRKWPTVDVVALYSRADAIGWNRLLATAFRRCDIPGMTKLLYGLQAGMSDAARSGVVDEKMSLWFLRIQKSIENTVRDIVRSKYPHPLDNPLKAKDADALEFAHVKKKRDEEFQNFMQESRF